MDDSQALAWLYGRQALGIKLGLDKVRGLAAALDDPHLAFRSVHVAGTNGKGSVTAMVAAALTNAGHRVGVYTSPHLVRFTERINVEGQEIPRARVAHWCTVMRPFVDRLDAEGTPPTFFELVTVLAFLHFRDEGVDWAVVETGMGGRLDATNILVPDATVITNVGMDHAAFLGGSLADIAAEKAGIMKPGVPCITGATQGPLLAIKAVSHGVQAPMSVLDEDYLVRPAINGLALVHPAGEAHYQIRMAGGHQLRNAALAIATCDALRSRGVHVPGDAVQRALATTQVPCRMESLHVDGDAWGGAQGRVEVLLDGAHNEDGAIALRRHLAERDLTGFHLITGFNQDKPWARMLAQWAPLAAQVWAVPLRSGRTLDPALLEGEVRAIGIPFATCPDVRTALGRAVQGGARTVLVAGSLFLAGEARAVLRGEPLEEIRGDQ